MANPIMVDVGSLGMYTPAETIELVSRAGVRKAQMRPDKIFFAAVGAGCFVSFAGGAFFSVTTAPWFSEHAPGFVRLVGALIFPSALVMIM